MVDKSAGDYSGSLFLTDNGQDMTKKIAVMTVMMMMMMMIIL
jgi:hypothetical protein